MKIYRIQFSYRKDGRANGAKFESEFVVIGGDTLTAQQAEKEADKNEHVLSGYKYDRTNISEVHDLNSSSSKNHFVRGKLIIVPESCHNFAPMTSVPGLEDRCRNCERLRSEHDILDVDSGEPAVTAKFNVAKNILLEVKTPTVSTSVEMTKDEAVDLSAQILRCVTLAR